jgi:hypothetical protein
MAAYVTVAKLFGTAATGLLGGALVFVSFAEAPTLRSLARLDEATAQRVFGVWWPTSAKLMAPLVASATLSLGASFALTHDYAWLAAGLAVGSLLPYTMLIMGGDIETLRKPGVPNVVTTIDRFCRRHHLRTAVVVGVFVWCLTRLQ